MIGSGKESQLKKQFFFAMAATFLWGMLAHGYGFLHDSFSGDSLSEFYGAMGSNAWKIQLGRFVVPAYKAVFRTDLTLPWLVGMLSLLWIGLAVFLVVRMFRMESGKQIFLTAGIFAANLTVAATAASYLHDYDCDMFALLCSAAAAYLWKTSDWKGILAGAVLVALSMGIYQSYLLVAVVLVMFSCILDLLNRADAWDVLKRGLKAVAMVLLGGIVYYAALHLVLKYTGIPLHTGDTNSLDAALALTPRSILSLTYHAYLDCFDRLLHVQSPYPAPMIQIFTLLMMLVSGGTVLLGLWNRQVTLPGKALCLLLTGMLPFGMNLIYVLVGGIVHDLMVYGIWLFYLLVLLLTDWLAAYGKRCTGALGTYRKLPQWLCMAMLFVILYGNVQTANALYLKKDMEQDAYLALMNRIVYRMETVEDYVPGETPVVFVGSHRLLNKAIPGFEAYRSITGMASPMAANTAEDYRLRSYFQTVMNYPANIPGSDVFRAMEADPRVAEMPAYPDTGSIAMVDGTMVVKLG